MFKQPCPLSAHDFGTARSKHVKAIIMLNKQNEIIDLSTVKRAWGIIPDACAGGFKVLVLHTDPNVNREERNLKDKIPKNLLTLIRDIGKTRPPTEFSEALPFEGSNAEVLDLNRHTNGFLRPTIKINYQFTKGGSGLILAILMTKDNYVVGLRTHKALTIHPGEQCLVALRLRIRIPGGVACYTTPIPPKEILFARPEAHVYSIGEPMPIDESYYGELYITVPNFSQDIMTYARGTSLLLFAAELTLLKSMSKKTIFARSLVSHLRVSGTPNGDPPYFHERWFHIQGRSCHQKS